jgi:hypothetical protein
MRLRHYTCIRCHNNTPAQVAARARYRASAKWRASYQAQNATKNKRRIFIGHDYHSLVKDPEVASAVNAHIKERLCELVTRQQAGAQAEGDSVGAIPAEAAS